MRYLSIYKLEYIFLIKILIAIDQISKIFLIGFIKEQPGLIYPLTKWCDLVYAWNYGISFGWFSKYFQYSNYIFAALNSLIVIYISYLAITTKISLQRLGLVIIIGGALGNLIDRFIRGAVFDFIYLHYGQYDFAVFNIADCFVNIGVFLVIISYFAKPQPQPLKDNLNLK